MNIEFSAILDGARGRLGGLVFSANATGPYLKTFTMPKRKTTVLQSARRGVFGQQGQAWRDLTQSQRDDWNTYAADAAQAKTNSLGQTYYANGFNWFVALNANLGYTGGSTVATAPTGSTPTTPTLTSLTITAPGTSSNSLSLNVGSFGSNDCVISLTNTRSEAAQVPVAKSFKFQTFTANASISDPISLGDIQDLFGTVFTGQLWFADVYAQNADGRRSAPARVTSVAV